MSDIEQTAIEVVAKAVAHEPKRVALAKAIARVAGNMVARLTGNEEACILHSELAKRHYQRIGKDRR